jgi:hypothetical protein
MRSHFVNIIFYMLVASSFFVLEAQENHVQEVVGLKQLQMYDEIIISPQNFVNSTSSKQVLKFESMHFCPSLLHGNNISVFQQGNSNKADIYQQGNGDFDLLQKGNNNNYRGIIAGEENLIRVLQLGNNNFVNQDLWGGAMNLKVIQEGNNHQLHQTEKDGSSPAYIIHQQGNSGMKVFVEHQKF